MQSILGRGRQIGVAFIVMLLLVGCQITLLEPETLDTPTSGASGTGLVSVASDAGVAETADRLEAALQEAGLTILAVVHHAANAKQAELELRPTRLILAGNPRLGTPLMQENQTVGIDLPQKFLVWEDAQGEVFITYNDPEYLAGRHGLTGQDELLSNIANALRNFAESAAGAESDTGAESAP